MAVGSMTNAPFAPSDREGVASGVVPRRWPHPSRAARRRQRARSEAVVPKTARREQLTPDSSSWWRVLFRQNQHLPHPSGPDEAPRFIQWRARWIAARFIDIVDSSRADDPPVRRNRPGNRANRSIPVERVLDAVMDPSRAPAGHHTLIADTYVPNWLADGSTWAQIKESYAREVLLKKLQQYAPNINASTIIGSYVDARESLEAANPSFVEGTTNGGERIQAQLGYFRPFPGYAHYRSPIRRLYMTGPHCHPGGGISGAGPITARVMLEDRPQGS